MDNIDGGSTQRSMGDKIALALQGFGAGVQGQGPYFQHMLNQQEQQLSEGRKMALIQDAYSVQQHLQSGNIPTARATLINRLQAIKKLGGDPSDTIGVLQKVESGDIPGALQDVSTVVNFAQANGLLKLPKGQQPQHQINSATGQVLTVDSSGRGTASDIENFRAPTPKQVMPKTQIVDGQVVIIDPTTGQATAAPVQGFQKDRTDINLRMRDQQLRERQLQLQQAAEDRQTNKLSAGLEKALLVSQDQTVKSQQKSNKFDVLANDYERLKIEGGLKSTMTESLKAVLGSQDAVSEFKRQVNEVRMSEAIKMLPPGAASDADIKLVLSSQPKENASPEQIASYLRGAAKVSRFEAGFHQFKADFISNRNTGKGLNQAWRSKINSPALKRDISLGELYETAQNRGTTPEDVASQLGIKGPLY